MASYNKQVIDTNVVADTTESDPPESNKSQVVVPRKSELSDKSSAEHQIVIVLFLESVVETSFDDGNEDCISDKVFLEMYLTNICNSIQ